MQLLQEFQEFISENKLFSKKDRLLLAVSGGMDSVVLCALCQQADIDFTIAHGNFQLRGAESDRDEKFVKKLGEGYGKEVLVNRFDTKKYAAEKKISVQVAARELRYGWFREIMEQHRATNGRTAGQLSYIATAHHLDDNIETLLMHFFRGTGIAGLRAIPVKQEELVRPLLFARKEQLKEFADMQHLEWVEDSSNESDKYSRNYFRHRLIPLIQEIYPEVVSNLAGNIDRFRDIEQLYRQAILLHKRKLLVQNADDIQIPVLKLKKMPALNSISFEIIRDFGFSAAQVPELISLLDSETGKFILSPTHRILKNRKWLIISPAQNKSTQTILIEGNEKKVHFQNGLLIFEELRKTSDLAMDDANTAMLDADQVQFPLLLRKWKTGDYFYPLGMRKKKKLARFFIDNKLSKLDKEKAWVLETDKKIIWVLGMRIDDRFKISPQTSRVLKIEMRMA